jgi:CHRD domain
MLRQLRILAFALASAFIFSGQANGHGGHEHRGRFTHYGFIDDFHTSNSTTDATGEIFLTLNQARTELKYEIVLDGVLGLKANPADRTAPDDIIGMHLHQYIPGVITGPHILNIFGLATYATPAEEDADLVIDYQHHTLTGIFDLSDATIDPNTGQPHFQFFPLTSKIIHDWLDELDNGELMLGIHTNESGFPAMAIHGHISRVVPEPSTYLLFTAGAMMRALLARKRRMGKGVRSDSAFLLELGETAK